MAMLSMCVYSTQENNKDECLEATLDSLYNTVDFDRHRLILSVNGFTDETLRLLERYESIISHQIFNETNLGTAEGINKAWALRKNGEHLLKMDDDIVHETKGWLDELENAIRLDPQIGLVACKRKDLRQCPQEESEWFKSELIMLPHVAGEKWVVVERTRDIMGSCVLHNYALIDKIGGLFQFGKYGFDDNLMAVRSRAAGFYNCFLPHIPIDHIDRGGTQYQKEKEKMASESWVKFQQLANAYEQGTESLYHPIS